jgi:hypothetical protein
MTLVNYHQNLSIKNIQQFKSIAIRNINFIFLHIFILLYKILQKCKLYIL